MRAKEYIAQNSDKISHLAEVSQVLADITPLRLDKQATDEYFNHRLSADIRRRDYLLRMELYEQGNAMQKEKPVLEEIADELPVEISAEVREQLFHVIAEDESFGYLYFLLGTEQNSKRKHNPIDCLPDEGKIRDAIVRYRDDYPKTNLDDYINDDLNYQQYDRLTSGGYMADEDQIMLHYFNNAFEIYDQLRLHKQSVSGARSYLRTLQFVDDNQKYWILEYVITLIDEYEHEDEQLARCRKEIEKIILPLQQTVVKQEDMLLEKSKVYLNSRKGTKLDLIRIVNVLYELGFFTDEAGNKIQKKIVFATIGKALNIDLTSYDKDLSRSLSDSTALDKHQKIFNDMLQCMTSIFNSK